MMKTKKAKSVFSALFAVIMALSLVVGLNLFKTDAKADEETPAATTAWQFSDPSRPLTEVSGSGIMYGAYAGGAIINNTDILQAPNRTVTFQFLLSNSPRWTGLVLLNGKDGWQGTAHTAGGAAGDKFPHIIAQDGSAQFFPVNSGLPLEGINGMPSKLSDQLHTVEIHIGTGADGDVSYMKIDGSMLGHQANAEQSLWDIVTVDSFPNGCYFVIGTGDVASCKMLMGEYNAPYVEYSSVSNALNGTVDLSAGVLPEEMTFTVKNVTGTAKLTVNGNDVTDENAYAIADVDGGKQVTIKSAFWNTYIAQITKTTAITLVAENGKASVVTTVQKAAPPVWSGANYAEIESVDDVSFMFEYSGAVTQDSIVVKTGVKDANSEPLVGGTDYTLAQDGKIYTFNLKKEYLEKQIGVYRGLSFSITIGEDSLEGSLYCKLDTAGWTTREVDLVKDTELVTEGHYVSANLRAFNANTLSSRIYYNEGFDVTKPFSLEVEAFGDGTEWALLGVMDSLKYMDYFSDGTAKDIALTALFFGNGRADIQKLGGFEATASTNADYSHLSKVKNLVVEIYFGEKDASEGYFKVNGQNIATPSALQKDFVSGLAYVGFFFNHQKTNFSFKANKDMNGVAVTGPVAADDERLYTIDIAAPADDLVLDVINTDGTNLKVSCNGTEAAAGDIAYADGKLTVKKSFFQKLSFAKRGELVIEDTATGKGTAINLTFTSSKMENAHIVFETKGDIQDANFKLDGYTSVESVMKGETELDSSEWYFTNGVLTVKKANIADENGATEFIAVSDGKLIPLYVYVDKFENGYVKSGAGTTETGNDAFLLTSVNDVTLQNVYDFTEGFTMKIDFKSTAGYYKSGLNYQNPGYILFNFYDPYSKITLTYYVYTNFGENVTANDTALYEKFYMTDSEGNKVVLDTERTVNIDKSENPAALGAHVIKFGVNEAGNITVKIDSARALVISDSIGTFNLGASILTVTTPVSVENGEMKVAFKQYGNDDTVDYNAIELGGGEKPGESEKPSESEKPGESVKPAESGDGSTGSGDKKGCGSCSGSVAVGAILLPALAAGLIILRKKKNDD